jgi:nucleoside-diphosphate-sugar epimerase
MGHFTVIGGAGFIGSELVRRLRAEEHSYCAPARGETLERRNLGHVVYCAGLTGDWRARPYDAVDAHVATLIELVRTNAFDSLLYLSSTRVYDRHPGPLAHEDDDLRARPQAPEDLYALSKAAGEAVALACGGRVARLSNAYGPDLERHAFLSIVLREAVEVGRVMLESSLESARDFVAVTDAVAVLMRIALEGRERVYNVASGARVTNLELTRALAGLTGCDVVVRPGAPCHEQPVVDTSRIRGEFGFSPARLLDDLPVLLEACRRSETATS